MKIIRCIISLIIAVTLICGSFSVFAEEIESQAKSLEGFDNNNCKLYNDNYEVECGNPEFKKLRFLYNSKEPISTDRKVIARVGNFDSKTGDYIYKNSSDIVNAAKVFDGDKTIMSICNPSLFSNGENTYYENGEVVVDYIVELDEVMLLKAFYVVNSERNNSQMAWYQIYTSKRLEDIGKKTSLFAEYKNVAHKTMQKYMVIDTNNAIYGKYVMFRVLYPFEYEKVGNPKREIEKGLQVTFGELAVFGDACKHRYKQTDYSAPTCTKTGSKTEICEKCGNEKTTKLSAIPHTNTVKTTAATYFAAGKKVTKCSVCGKTVTTKLPKKTLKTPSAKLTATKKALKIKVNKVTGQTGFQIRYRQKGKSKWTVKTYTGKKTVTKTIKLKQKKNYQVSIRAMVKSGRKNAYSNWSKIYTKTTK